MSKRKNSFDILLRDSLKVKNLNPKYPLWIPVSEVIGLNLGLGAFNTYVAKSEFAKISFKTIAQNFTSVFVWDHDHFITNFSLILITAAFILILPGPMDIISGNQRHFHLAEV
ncbi:MAG: hypothetical protein IPL16_19870 [Ignavibacteria bacterium]|nr:hypothetical protein [Ignavibacteria bacterium]